MITSARSLVRRGDGEVDTQDGDENVLHIRIPASLSTSLGMLAMLSRQARKVFS